MTPALISGFPVRNRLGRRLMEEILAPGEINGDAPWDLQVHDGDSTNGCSPREPSVSVRATWTTGGTAESLDTAGARRRSAHFKLDSDGPETENRADHYRILMDRIAQTPSS